MSDPALELAKAAAETLASAADPSNPLHAEIRANMDRLVATCEREAVVRAAAKAEAYKPADEVDMGRLQELLAELDTLTAERGAICRRQSELRAAVHAVVGRA
jgi:hypothetical protein